MRLTEEQKKKFTGYLGLLKKKTGISVDADRVLNEMYSAMEHEDEDGNHKSFRDAYKYVFAKTLNDQVAEGCMNEIKKGKSPAHVGSYFGPAMNYLYECLADEETKQQDLKIKSDLTLQKQEGKRLYEEGKKDFKKLEDLILKGQKLTREQEKEYHALGLQMDKGDIMKEEAERKLERTIYHMDMDEYKDMVDDVLRTKALSKLNTVLKYEYLATEGHDEEEASCALNLVDANYSNMHVFMRHGDLDAKSFHDTLTTSAVPYMMYKHQYSKLSVFKKWFWPTGYHLRTAMANIVDPLEEAKEWLVKHGEVTYEDGGKTVSIRKMDIEKELENVCTKERVVVGQDKRLLGNLKAGFDSGLPNPNAEFSDENVMKYVIEPSAPVTAKFLKEEENTEIEGMNETGALWDADEPLKGPLFSA